MLPGKPINPLFFDVCDMTETELRARTLLSGDALARIHIAMGIWVLDNADRFTSLNDALSIFMTEYNAMPDKSQRVLLNEKDIETYTGIVDDVRAQLNDPLFRSILVNQIFSMNGAYVCAYISCTRNTETLFWIVIDAEGDATIVDDKAVLDALVLELSGAKGYKFITYSFNRRSECTKLIEGTRGRNHDDNTSVG